MTGSFGARLLAAGAALALSALALSACSSETAGPTPEAGSGPTVGSVDLSGVCPATIVVQTDWNPESEHGYLYDLFGDDAVIDAGKKAVAGPLYSQGEYTGVDLEVRAGGPAIGFQTVSSQLYLDTSITLGYVSTDEAVSASGVAPTTAVIAPLNVSPLMIMWDPATYPDVQTIADLGKTDAIVRYYGGAAYMEYLTETGVLPVDHTDGSFDGTPAAFVAAGGADGQQGYATSDPLIYGTELKEWGKPIAYQLINDAGFPYYQSSISVRTGELEELTPCLTALVPVLQQAEVDYFADPDPANALILNAVEEYDNGWVYTAEDAEYSYTSMLEDGIVANGSDGTLGSLDETRVQKIIDITLPIFSGSASGEGPKEGLTAADIATNEFLDPTIGLPGGS